MAFIDLDNFDPIDLLPVAYFPEDKKTEYISAFSNAYLGYLMECIGSKLSPEDAEAMEILITDESVSQDEIGTFFKSKIPQYDDFLLAVALKFKKEYLLVFYNSMLSSTKEKNHESASIWEEIVKFTHEDNWDRVYDLIKQIEEKEKKLIESQQQIPQIPMTAPPPPVV